MCSECPALGTRPLCVCSGLTLCRALKMDRALIGMVNASGQSPPDPEAKKSRSKREGGLGGTGVGGGGGCIYDQ